MEVLFLSFATTRMECLDSISHLDDLDPSLQQLCSCPAISSPLGFVIWVLDSNSLFHLSPTASSRPVSLAESLGLLMLGANLKRQEQFSQVMHTAALEDLVCEKVSCYQLWLMRQRYRVRPCIPWLPFR